MAGNNGVHRGPAKVKRVRAAFMRLYDAHPDKLDELALAMHTRATSGEASAATLIRDTMDGKPPQAIVGDDDYAPVRVEEIRNVIVDPKVADGRSDSEGVQPSTEPGSV